MRKNSSSSISFKALGKNGPRPPKREESVTTNRVCLTAYSPFQKITRFYVHRFEKNDCSAWGMFITRCRLLLVTSGYVLISRGSGLIVC